MATRLGLKTEVLAYKGKDDMLPNAPGWRRGVQADMIEERLKADTQHAIKAVCVVHNETSTGVTSDIRAVRRAIDAAKHPALLLVDSISGLACADYRHDEWGVDVTISGSQKGLMLPPGISFNALSPKAIEASKTAKLPKAFWAWDEIVEMNKGGYWPYTPNTNLLYGLAEACDMLLAPEHGGLPAVFARHERWGEGVRAAVRAWGLEIQCADPAVYSPVLTGVIMPEGVDADAVRKIIYERFDCSLGTGLGKVKGRMFRIGHLGDCNDLTLMAALAGCEMGLKLAGVKLAGSGVQAAMEYLRSAPGARGAAKGRLRPGSSGINHSKRRGHMKRRTFICAGAAGAATLAAARARGRKACPADRFASSWASRPAAAPTCWRASWPRSCTTMWNTTGHGREQGRCRRRASRPTTWPRRPATARCC